MYRYLAYTKERKIVEGSIESTSEREAEDILYRAGFESIVSLKQEKSGINLKSLSKYFTKISTDEIIDFVSELASLIEAGLTLLTTMKLLLVQTGNNLMKDVISKIIFDIQNGKQLHEALAAHPKLFSSSFRGIIQASERSGTLDEGLKQISTDMKRQAETRSKIRRALIQPAFIMVVAIFAVIILTTVVLPPLVAIFEQFGASAPITARILIAVTHFINNYILQLLSAVVVLAVIIVVVARMPATKTKFDKYILRLPFMGTTILWQMTAGICRNLGVLVKAGIILPDAINITLPTISNGYIRKAMSQVRFDILQGKLLSTAIKQTGIFPGIISEMVATGETTGHLEQSFITMADYYSNKVEGRLVKITTLLEPILIVLLGLFVGFLAISIIGTMYGLPGAMGF